MNGETDQLKVDVLLLTSDETRSTAILNYNIPERHLRDDQVTERVRQSLLQYLGPEHAADAYFSLSATYTLRHRETGEIRHWSGSFQPRRNELAAVTPYRRFQYDTFVSYVNRNTDPAAIRQHLLFAGLESLWQFDQLGSVVVSVNVQLPNNHPLVKQHVTRKSKNSRASFKEDLA